MLIRNINIDKTLFVPQGRVNIGILLHRNLNCFIDTGSSIIKINIAVTNFRVFICHKKIIKDSGLLIFLHL